MAWDLETSERIGDLLANDICHSLNSACTAAGVSPYSVATMRTKARRGLASEYELELLEPIEDGLQRQLYAHRKSVETKLLEDPRNAKSELDWRKFRLTTAAPHEHSTAELREISGPDGGAVELSAVALDRLLEALDDKD